MLQVHNDKIPLNEDKNGVFRVAGTRVPLDAVVDMYDEGASAEEIVEQFDTLSLSVFISLSVTACVTKMK